MVVKVINILLKINLPTQRAVLYEAARYLVPQQFYIGQTCSHFTEWKPEKCSFDRNIILTAAMDK